MANEEALVNAMAGMSPQQAQQFTNTAVGALQQKKKREATQQYRQRRLDIMRDKEQRMAAQAKFDRAAKTAAMRMEKQMNDLKADLTRKRQQLTETERKYKQEQFEALKNKARTLKNMNQEMPIPGTDDTIKAGAAVQAGIFGDLLEQTTSSAGVSGEDLPNNVQEYMYMRNELDIPEEEALSRAGLEGENLDRLIKMMGTIPMMSKDEAKKKVKELKNATRQGKSRNENEGDPNTTGAGVSQSEVNKWFENEYGE